MATVGTRYVTGPSVRDVVTDRSTPANSMSEPRHPASGRRISLRLRRPPSLRVRCSLRAGMPMAMTHMWGVESRGGAAVASDRAWGRPELTRLTPGNCDELLLDDVLWAYRARRPRELRPPSRPRRDRAGAGRRPRRPGPGCRLHKQIGLDGAEVSNDVVESPSSIVVDQVENRLHTITAVMVDDLGTGR